MIRSTTMDITFCHTLALGEETTTARAGLSLAERGLALLRGRQQFLRSGGPSLDER